MCDVVRVQVLEGPEDQGHVPPDAGLAEGLLLVNHSLELPAGGAEGGERAEVLVGFGMKILVRERHYIS